jgi:acyl transferase domain-containing protein
MNVESCLAVVGMAVRFPGAADLDAYWRNLAGGVESITLLPPPPQAVHIPACGLLADPDCFDAEFFGYAPRDALIIDPQHRVFLECAWEALEHAGYDPARYPGPIGVYAGSSQTGYAELLRARRDADLLAGVGEFALRLGCGIDFLTTRVAYKLGLRGPAVTVQTACSTSLVAIHLAGQALLAGECDMALAGGVTVHVPAYPGEYSPDGILSIDGHCRAFDAAAGGTIGGDGAGVVVLKRLGSAIADGDTIHAILLGSAINNDGADKIGYTAPSITGQSEAIATALRLADVPVHTVSYVETHGTATPLGDPIEIAALTAAFSSAAAPGAPPGRCRIGSVKTNIGHTDAAAGVAGFIKVVLALRHRQLPPSLHFTRPNPAIEFGGFEVNSRLTEWTSPDSPRRAGVNSLGIGGTNAYAVLEEAPASAVPATRRPWRLVPVTGRSRRALDAATSRLAGRLAEADPPELADLAWTAQIGRRHHAHRRYAVAADVAGLVAGLTAGDAPIGNATEQSRPVVFLFPGQGGQYVGMTRELYAHEPAFAAQVDACAELFAGALHADLREVLYGTPGDPATEARLAQMTMAQACIFTVEYALAQLWRHWGVTPHAVAGHSLGAYAAACLSGVFDLRDAVALVAARGRLLQDLPDGGMIAVPLPERHVRELLRPGLAIAAVNAPEQCVVSGARAEVDRLLVALRDREIDARALRISAAAHSVLVEPAIARFRAAVAALSRREPALPIVSDHSGTWLTGAQATDPGYWAAHLRGTVRFADALATLLGSGEPWTLLEVGPGRTLATLAKQHPAHTSRHTVLTSLPHAAAEQPEYPHVLDAAGRLWLTGHDLDWAHLHDGEAPRRVPLPGYPFQRMRYRVDPDPSVPVIIEPLSQDAGAGDPDDAYVAPRTATEQAVAGAFAAILGVIRAGANDSFLDLGGDSLIAAQLTAWIRRTYQLPIAIRAVFKTPTVAGLAGVIDAGLASGAPPGASSPALAEPPAKEITRV